MQGEIPMVDNRRALDLIEHAERETPLCVCGQLMLVAARPDGIWLECASLRAPAGSRVTRFLSGLIAPGHARQRIIDPLAEAA
jgi:hypothetical protein